MSRVLVALSSLHRVPRGAEVALEAIAAGLALRGHEITVLGSGGPRPDRPYEYRRCGVIPRERFEGWPRLPFLGDSTDYESLTFTTAAALRYRPQDYDVTMTCSYPWENLLLRRPTLGGRRPAHVFVTENGDWPAAVHGGQARFFGCDGLVCINPVYYETNRSTWNCALIPNGVDVERFRPGPSERQRLGLPPDRPIVLMVSALIESKRVAAGIEAVARLDDEVVLVVAGSGPLGAKLDARGRELLGDRYIRRVFSHDDMPGLYRSADVLLHLSRHESFALIYAEALATGLAVVAHRSPDSEWAMGGLGYLVDTEDRDLLVATLNERLRHPDDAGAARVQEARSRFAWPIVVAQYDDFLTSIIESRERESACARWPGGGALRRH